LLLLCLFINYIANINTKSWYIILISTLAYNLLLLLLALPVVVVDLFGVWICKSDNILTKNKSDENDIVIYQLELSDKLYVNL
jgi:hypothetical protein